MKLVFRNIILGLLFVPLLVQSQTEDKRIIDNQLWLDYYQYYYFKPDWQFYGDAGTRTVLEKWSWFKMQFRPSIRWKKHKLWEVHGGIGAFYTVNIDEVNTFELRPWQGFRVNWPTFNSFKVYHYFRLEERLNFPTDTWVLEFNFRLRYRLALNALVYTFPNENHSTLFIPAYVELFGSLGEELTETFSNRSRIGVGLGYKRSKTWTFEARFVAQYSRTGDGDEFKTSDRLIQLKVRKFLVKKDYKSKLLPDDFEE